MEKCEKCALLPAIRVVEREEKTHSMTHGITSLSQRGPQSDTRSISNVLHTVPRVPSEHYGNTVAPGPVSGSYPSLD